MAAVVADRRPRQPRSEQNTSAAFLLALAMHAMLVLALWLSVQWRTESAGAVVVELWAAPPQPVAVAPPPPPAPQVAEPERPDADIVIEKKTPPKVEPPPPDAKKIEAERRRVEAEKKRIEAEKKQLELERKKQAEAMAHAAEQKREEERREAVRKAEEARMLAQAGSAGGSADTAAAGAGRGDPSYAAQLIALIRPRIVFAIPDGTSPAVYAEFQVELLPTGEILAVRKLRASGLAGYDEAVERAIRRTDPFPRKRDGSVERTVIIRFRPVDTQPS